jgi:hypothetical protein
LNSGVELERAISILPSARCKHRFGVWGELQSFHDGADAMTEMVFTCCDRVPARSLRILRSAVFAGTLLAAFSALAQDAQPQPPADAPASAPGTPPPATPAPNPAFRPGFIDALGRWLDDSKAKLDEQLKGTQEAIDGIGSQTTDAVKDAAGAVSDAAGAAKQATDTIVGLPGTRIVTGRQLCPRAPNGAPDCAPAAQALCRAQGFDAGRGLDINTAEKCPTRAWLSGRPPKRSDCWSEAFVTRAVCQ